MNLRAKRCWKSTRRPFSRLRTMTLILIEAACCLKRRARRPRSYQLGHLAFEVSFIRLKDDARGDRRPDGHVEVAAELLHAVVPATAQGLAVSMRHEVGRANRVE